MKISAPRPRAPRDEISRPRPKGARLRPLMKTEALLRLARLRQSSRLDGSAAIGDFHDGIFECDHVSPWTKSGCNVDAEIMVVGQDWLSSEVLEIEPPNLSVAELGFDPKFPTNANLNGLLERHFDLSRADCYLTNLFPFVKRGKASASIPMNNLISCAQRFTLPEIEIVSPQIVICLGLKTFLSLMRAVGLKGSMKMDQAVSSPFAFGNSKIYCVAHPGSFGMNNRGRSQVESDWRHLAACTPLLRR